jgi:hypothetical protein
MASHLLSSLNLSTDWTLISSAFPIVLKGVLVTSKASFGMIAEMTWIVTSGRIVRKVKTA